MKVMESLCKVLVSTLLILGLSLSVKGQASKSLTDTLDVNEITSLTVNNQYGDIIVSTWEENKIGYDVQIIVLKDDRDVAEDLLDRLVYKVEEFNGVLDFDYEVEEMNAGFFERLWSDITLEFDQSAIQITVELTVPKDFKLDLTNKFGDITIRDWSGNLSVKQKHGNVKVSGEVKDLRLEQSFGDADFNVINTARIDIRNVEFNAKSIKEFSIESHGSEINLENALSLTLDCSKDDLTIDEVDNVKGTINYGSLYIKDLVAEIHASMKLTDLTIKNIVNDNAQIFIEQTNSEVDITLNGHPMSLDANLEDGLLNVPESSNSLETTILDDKDEKRTISGNIGTNPKGKIILQGKKGVIIIR